MFNSRGFTLIEVLVSMVILAVGLLGLAGMQALSLRDNLDAYYYQQATLLAYEMQDRIRGNSAEWTIENGKSLPNVPSTEPSSSCDSIDTACNSIKMADYDYWYWKDSVEKNLPAPKIGNIVEVKLSKAVTDEVRGRCNSEKTYETSLCLITRWGRNVSKDTADTATYYLEVTP